MKQFSKATPVTFAFIMVSFLMFLPAALATIDVDMFLNDGGFVSLDHLVAESRMNPFF